MSQLPQHSLLAPAFSNSQTATHEHERTSTSINQSVIHSNVLTIRWRVVEASQDRCTELASNWHMCLLRIGVVLQLDNDTTTAVTLHGSVLLSVPALHGVILYVALLQAVDLLQRCRSARSLPLLVCAVVVGSAVTRRVMHLIVVLITVVWVIESTQTSYKCKRSDEVYSSLPLYY
eukprot:7595-Heterococcus_DN1.PRE.4